MTLTIGPFLGGENDMRSKEHSSSSSSTCDRGLKQVASDPIKQKKLEISSANSHGTEDHLSHIGCKKNSLELEVSKRGNGMGGSGWKSQICMHGISFCFKVGT